MSELMRMTVLRTPKPADPGFTIPLTTQSAFQLALKGALPAESAGPQWKDLATAFVGSGAPDASVFDLEALCETVLSEIERNEPAAPLDRADVRKRFEDAAGAEAPGDVLQRADIVSDWLVALAITRSRGPVTERLSRYRRGLWLLQIATSKARLSDDASTVAIARIGRAPLALPAWLRLSPPPPTPLPPPTEQGDVAAIEQEEEEIEAVSMAAKEMATLPTTAFKSIGAQEASHLNIATTGLHLTPDGFAKLSKQTQDVLRGSGVKEGQFMSFVDMTSQLKKQVGEKTAAVAKKYKDLRALKVVIPNGKGLPPTIYNPGAPPATTEPVQPEGIFPGVPMPLFQVGVGDLYTVEHVLKGYRGGEISRIENVMMGETRSRDHRSLLRSEETVTEETETTTENERSLESTTRFELQAETSNVLKEQQSIKAGVGVSAQLGPVKLSTSLDYSYERTQEESKKAVTKNSREVIEKAVNKITERVRTERSAKVLRETEEKNFSSFDNTAGDEHVVGVYQWLDKVYEVQVWKHDDGPYTMYDFIVPDPAALLLHAYKDGPSLGVGITMPEPFTIAPDQITPTNYLVHASNYGATNIEPPPDEPVIIGAALALTNATAGDSDKETTPLAQISKELKVPDHFMSVMLWVSADWSKRGDDEPKLTLLVADQRIPVAILNDPCIVLSIEGTMPIALVGENIVAAAATVNVLCMPKPSAMVAWRIKTWEALRASYEKKLAAYNDAVAAALYASSDVRTNPAENRRIIETELKRGCLALITKQALSTSTAVVYDKSAPPKIDFQRAAIEGPFVRFFEDAFEWEQLSFLCYPYFWANHEQWVARLKTSNDDPMMAEFLRSGAARVIVPVKKGLEAQVELAVSGQGRPWETPPTKAVLSTMSADLVAEMEDRDQPTHEAKLERSWDVVVPTTLVQLRQNNQRPTFKPAAGGTYIPEDP